MKPLFGYLLLLLINSKLCNSQFSLGCRHLGKSSVTCFESNLRSVPQNLRDSIEILNLANNRIRKIQKNSFERYTKLRVLQLRENTIFHIEEGSFEMLSNLEQLDLSLNALHSIPLELFHLPSLRFLYLDSNPMDKLLDDLKSLETPIEAPLEYLNIADCELKNIPKLGILPKLTHLNASLNPLKDISFEIFPLFCALESIDLTRTQMPHCKCQEIAELVSEYYRETMEDRLNFCDKTSEECPEPMLQKIFLESSDYQKCTYTISHPPISKKTWIIIGICLIVIFLIVILVVRQFQKKRQKKKSRKKKTAAPAEKVFIYNNNDTTP